MKKTKRKWITWMKIPFSQLNVLDNEKKIFAHPNTPVSVM